MNETLKKNDNPASKDRLSNQTKDKVEAAKAFIESKTIFQFF